MIVLDIETTGVNLMKHAIISVGALEYENPENQFYGECRIWDGADISEEALEINKFGEADITDPTKQSQEIVLRALTEWVEKIEDRTVLALNGGYFDLRFIETALEREGLPIPFAKRTIDLHAVSYVFHKKAGIPIPIKNHHSGINLQHTLNLVGLGEITVPHNALEDAKLEAETFSRLTEGKVLFDEYREYSVPEKVVKDALYR